MVLIYLITSLWAQVYNHAYYGEKDFDLYAGPSSPDYRYLDYSSKSFSLDQEEKERYLEHLVGFYDEDLKRFLSEELIPGNNCPNKEFDEYAPYLQFSYRLITMSYLFENIQLRTQEAKKLEMKACQVNWKDVLKQCHGKTEDMKRFRKISPFIIENLKPYTVPMGHSFKKYQEDFWKSDDSQSTVSRLKMSCGRDCPEKGQGLEKELEKTCHEDLNLFKQICQEEDSLWGLSGQVIPFQLLSHAEMMRPVNKFGHAQGCLRRMAEQNKPKEKNYPVLENIFGQTFHHLNIRHVTYIQGSLFPAGSMKEYSDKGLKELFEEKKEPLPIMAQYRAKVVQSAPQVTKIVKVTPQAKKTEVPLEVVAPVKPQEVFKSAFWQAGSLRRNLGLDEVEVDMQKFKLDFIIPLEIAAELEKSLTEYMTRKALSEMKKFDKLGTEKGPVPLLFIKYMLDHNQHQGLYNLVGEVGDHFWVSNDLDVNPEIESEYIYLKNSAETDFDWIITVVTPEHSRTNGP